MPKKLIFCEDINSMEDQELYNLWTKRKEQVEKFQRKCVYDISIKIIKRIINLDQLKKKKIAYLGSGFAEEFFDLAKKYHLNTFFCLDVDLPIMRTIKKISDFHNISIFGVCGDCCYLPFRNQELDFVISKYFFEHTYDRELALKEQIRVLKPSGKIIIIDGNFLNPLTLIDLLIKYPIRSRRKYGGLKWIVSKKKIIKNIYDLGWKGKDEDIKSIFWWEKYLKKKFKTTLKIDIITTVKSFLLENNLGILENIIRPFYGAILIVLSKS